MYKKAIAFFRSRTFGAHWLKLLISDAAITVAAGVAAYTFNHGIYACMANLGPLLLELALYMCFYVAGFILLSTYNSFSRQPLENLWRAVAAIGVGTALIVAVNLLYSPSFRVFGPFGNRDLLLQILFIFMGMKGLRMLVRIHYDIYRRRSTSNGAYGLHDIALLNMEMADLLQRKPIEVDTEAIRREMRGRRICVTGAAGSIGSKLVELLATYEPASLVLVDQSETPLHDVRMMLERNHPSVRYKAIVTSICHAHRMERIFDIYRPEVVFHAAAYKHVPMMEDNPVESILNNVDGTIKLADLSVRYGVEKFVMISTDKAVNPTNVMGCSKRICEIYCQSLARDAARRGKCQFITTRFGNVLGSSGSVVPIFREQIRRGGPVLVTHPDIIRYFMLIPEACSLVLEAATIGHGGEIFAFDMGAPVRIADLARKMIAISGRRDIKIEYTGVRAGEKLYEEVLTAGETVLPTSHDKIKIASVREYDFEDVSSRIEQLIATARTYDSEATVRMMGEIVPEYTHSRYNSK